MKKSYLLGIVAAAAVGAVAGLLLAPEKGKDLRKKIVDKGTDFKDKLKNNIKSNVDRFRMEEEESLGV
jgi:gas vesicle protein